MPLRLLLMTLITLIGSIVCPWVSAGAADGFPSVTLSGHESQVRALAFDPEGALLASAERNSPDIQIWDVAEEQSVGLLKGHRDTVNSLVFVSSETLISASEDQTIKVWDLPSGKLVRQLLGHRGAIYQVDVSHDGQRLLSASADQSVRLWEIETGRELAVWEFETPLYAVRFAPNDRWFAAGAGDARLYVGDLAAPDEVRSYEGHEDTIWALDIHPDGTMVASGSWDGSVKLWSVGKGGELDEKPVTLAQYDTWVLSVGFSPDGQILAAGLLDWEKNSTMRLFDVATRQKLCDFDHRSRYALAFSPNGGELVAAGDAEGTIQLWRSAADAPTLLSPVSETPLEQSVDIPLRWKGSAGVVFYDVQIAADAKFEQILWEQSSASEGARVTLDTGATESLLSYWWRVRAHTFGATGEWSSPGEFRVIPIQGCLLQFDPPHLTLEQGEIAEVLVRVSNTIELTQIAFSLSFSPDALYVLRVTAADSSEEIPSEIQNSLGLVQGIVQEYPEGFSGSSNVAKLTLRALNPGESVVVFTDVEVGSEEDEAEPCRLQTLTISVQEPVAPWDVNRDGQVNVLDFVVIGQAFGQPVIGNPKINPDVNRDGTVDVLDFSLVAIHFGEELAAPTLRGITLDSDAQQALAALVDHLDRATAPGVQRALDYLCGYLQPLDHLGQNYPNPFNPETWIPYTLSQDGDVILRIYALDGRLIREFSLGFQRAGVYRSPDRAIHWDGTNQNGEDVSSGVYFYTFSSPHFSQTRRMHIVR